MINHPDGAFQNNDGDLLPETGHGQLAPEQRLDRVTQAKQPDAEAKQPDAEMAEQNERNQGNQAESEQACDPPLNQRASNSASVIDANPADHEMEAKESGIDEKLSSDEENHNDISASSDSESEPERSAYPIRQKRKSNYPPVHLEEHYIPFVWEFTDDESPYAPGCHLSASGRNKSTFPSQKSSRMSAAQNKSQKKRDNITDTSSEDSHWSVDIKLKDSYLS